MRNKLGRFVKGHTLTKGKNSPRWKGGISRVKRICIICNKEFIARKEQVDKKRGKFCSRKCHGIWVSKNKKGKNSHNWKGGKTERVCLNCSKKFFSAKNNVRKNWGKFCSVSCRAKYSKGKLGHNWRGGITPLIKKLRNSSEYKIWRKAVFERDNYTCIWCGKKGGELNADHIKQFAYYPELRFAIDNGRTLCVSCHRKTFNKIYAN